MPERAEHLRPWPARPARGAEAGSAVMAQNALSFGLTRSIRSRTARVSSTGDSALVLMRARSSVAGV
jgi:hypothetical protein